MEVEKKEYTDAKKELFGEESIAEKIIRNYFNKRDLSKQLLKVQPLYYDESKLWWFWNKKKFRWEKTDETNILNFVRELSFANTIKSKERTEILESLRQEARLNKPKEIKDSWIQFGNKIYDIETNEEFKAIPEYFVANPIPWELGKSEETPALDILFKSWVEKEHIQELYEIIAFCIVPSYFVHRLFCLIGSGANGKSTFLEILTNFMGKENLASSSLYLLLKQRFEGSKLLKKLVCLIGETNFDMINNTDFLKKLTGQDLIRAEFKGKDCFDFENYAKLIMATNSLPPTSDKTEGFYRRWKIIKFPNKFDKEADILINVQNYEYNNLALKCLNIAKKLWRERIFTNDGSFEERKKNYEDESNPLMRFIKEKYEKDINDAVLFQDFFDDFSNFLEERGMRSLTGKSVGKQLRNEGFEVKSMTKKGINGRFILGLKEKGKKKELTKLTK